MAVFGPTVLIAGDLSAYWFAGILTLAAAAIVTAVMLITSRSGDDDS